MAFVRCHQRLVFVALALLTVAAAPARADKCTSAKLKAVGKKEAGLLSCQSKVAAKNSTVGRTFCENKAKSKFSSVFAKAGICVGNEVQCETVADDCEATVTTAMTDTAYPSRCEAEKLKAAGKLASSELGCYGKAAAKGTGLDGACISKATGKFLAALTKAGTCPDGGSPLTLVETNCVQPLVTTDGGGTVVDVCPTTTTSTTSSTTTSSSTSSTTSTSTSTSSSTTTSTSSSTTTSTSSSTTTSTLICGNFITRWGDYGSTDGLFLYPFGVAVDGSGNVYVADNFNHRVQKFDNDGNFLTKWGSAGTGDGEFHQTFGPAIDGNGNVFVIDLDTQYLTIARIQKFDSAGTFLTKWGSPGTGDGQFWDSLGIAVDGTGNVFVTDGGSNANNTGIRKFDNTGAFLTRWGGSQGSGDGQFYSGQYDSPSGVAVDASGNVFAVDKGNNRVQKFTNTGTFVDKWGSFGTGDGQFDRPLGLGVDGSGNVYVADTANSRIQKFDNFGGFIAKWGTYGSGDGQLVSPTGVAVDGSGNVFVVDGNMRITKFGCP